MENCKKYERQYFMPPKFEYDWVKKDYVDAPPIWCSVDLRDALRNLRAIVQASHCSGVQRQSEGRNGGKRICRLSVGHHKNPKFFLSE